ncbi:hypothetical protein JL720_10181 [Aureococcus anophagefferens]|nr:hypothetical protein JL720_10181 [Aureococcus anophagefferens]
MEIAAGTVEQMMTGVTSLEAGDPGSSTTTRSGVGVPGLQPVNGEEGARQGEEARGQDRRRRGADGHVDVDEETMKHLREHENARIQAQLKQLRSIIPKEDGGDTTDADNVQLHLNQLSAFAARA